MTSYLDRYVAGEHEQVWSELIELGAAVREEPLLTDAAAVARETMRRVRTCLEILMPRLVEIGYRFGYDWIQPPRTGIFGTSERWRYRSLRAWAAKQPLTLVVHRDKPDNVQFREERVQKLLDIGAPQIIIKHEEQLVEEARAAQQPDDSVRRLNTVGATPPLSLAAWYEEVGEVNFVGDHPAWHRMLTGKDWADKWYNWYGDDWDAELHPFAQLDPLAVLSPDNAAYADWAENTGKILSRGYLDRVDLPIIQDGGISYAKPELDGNFYSIDLPCLDADAILKVGDKPQAYFVEYLRRAIRWGGFPGWESIKKRPEDDLRFLTEGLPEF